MDILSWNTCKLSVRHARTALEQLAQSMKHGKAILCLQEVNSWARACGHTYCIGKLRLILYSDVDSDCAIVVSKKLSKQQKGVYFRDYSCVVAVGRIIAVSIHLCQFDNLEQLQILEHASEDIWKIVSTFSETEFVLVIGMDANVTLPGEMDGLTGNNVIM